MGIFELFIVGIGLSMDAFAVAVGKGLCMKKLNKKRCLLIGALFGGFQGGMPLLGWLLGHQFQQYIKAVDHWIAFILLALIGGKMIKDALEEEEEQESCRLDIKELLMLSVATSIDALAVGVTFAFLEVHILPAISIIGCTTFLLSTAGVVIGNLFGSRYKQKAVIAGGIVLIIMGTKILFEHLM